MCNRPVGTPGDQMILCQLVTKQPSHFHPRKLGRTFYFCLFFNVSLELFVFLVSFHL